MTFDCIIANPPYGKIGVEITKTLIDEAPYTNISILGTRAMLAKQNENLSLEYVYIEGYVLSPLTKCKWVRQIILLGHKGNCRVIPAVCAEGHRTKKIKHNELRVMFSRAGTGIINQPLENLLTRSRQSSLIISVSDEDYEYINKHWDGMGYVERFWWMHDHGLYKQFIVENYDL